VSDAVAKREASQEVLKSGAVVSGELQNETIVSALTVMIRANLNAAKAANLTTSHAAEKRDLDLRLIASSCHLGEQEKTILFPDDGPNGGPPQQPPPVPRSGEVQSRGGGGGGNSWQRSTVSSDENENTKTNIALANVEPQMVIIVAGGNTAMQMIGLGHTIDFANIAAKLLPVVQQISHVVSSSMVKRVVVHMAEMVSNLSSIVPSGLAPGVEYSADTPEHVRRVGAATSYGIQRIVNGMRRQLMMDSAHGHPAQVPLARGSTAQLADGVQVAAGGTTGGAAGASAGGVLPDADAEPLSVAADDSAVIMRVVRTDGRIGSVELLMDEDGIIVHWWDEGGPGGATHQQQFQTYEALLAACDPAMCEDIDSGFFDLVQLMAQTEIGDRLGATANEVLGPAHGLSSDRERFVRVAREAELAVHTSLTSLARRINFKVPADCDPSSDVLFGFDGHIPAFLTEVLVAEHFSSGGDVECVLQPQGHSFDVLLRNTTTGDTCKIEVKESRLHHYFKHDHWDIGAACVDLKWSLHDRCVFTVLGPSSIQNVVGTTTLSWDWSAVIALSNDNVVSAMTELKNADGATGSVGSQAASVLKQIRRYGARAWKGRGEKIKLKIGSTDGLERTIDSEKTAFEVTQQVFNALQEQSHLTQDDGSPIFHSFQLISDAEFEVRVHGMIVAARQDAGRDDAVERSAVEHEKCLRLSRTSWRDKQLPQYDAKRDKLTTAIASGLALTGHEALLCQPSETRGGQMDAEAAAVVRGIVAGSAGAGMMMGAGPRVFVAVDTRPSHDFNIFVEDLTKPGFFFATRVEVKTPTAYSSGITSPIHADRSDLAIVVPHGTGWEWFTMYGAATSAAEAGLGVGVHIEIAYGMDKGPDEYYAGTIKSITGTTVVVVFDDPGTDGSEETFNFEIGDGTEWRLYHDETDGEAGDAGTEDWDEYDPGSDSDEWSEDASADGEGKDGGVEGGQGGETGEEKMNGEDGGATSGGAENPADETGRSFRIKTSSLESGGGAFSQIASFHYSDAEGKFVCTGVDINFLERLLEFPRYEKVGSEVKEPAISADMTQDTIALSWQRALVSAEESAV
jgi:hypothetical protein